MDDGIDWGYLEKTFNFRKAYPNNRFFDKEFIGMVKDKTVYVKIDHKDYSGEICSVDKNKNCEVFIDGIKYYFVYTNSLDEVILNKIK